jgi:diguanylate cyclase (GGDEF)-like protein
MSGVVEHLAELTGLRDRDLLDTTLVGALKDLLRPHTVAIYRCVGEVDGDLDQRRWLTRAHWGPGDAAATADPLWADVTSLPLVASVPQRQACLQRNQTVSARLDSGLCATYFALDADSETVGVLELHTAEPLGGEAARMVSSVLRVFRNFQGLLDYSERDTLTGLLNRKTFDSCFWRVMAAREASEALAPVETVQAVEPVATPGAEQRRATAGAAALATAWLAVVDIDHFKRINDSYGHLIGDEVLLLLSRLMRSSFRFHDHLFRYGGEEFVVLLRCGHAADAANAFERLRANVERYAFPQVGHITVSLGYTELRPADTPPSAFERADRAVYLAKQSGRNQVCHYADLLAQGKVQDALRDSDVELF